MATQIGEAIIKLSFDGKDLKASLTKSENTIANAGKSSGTSFANAWTFAAGSLISKGISKISSMITSNLDNAISRVDTLNQFPKVMSNLGVSATESEKAIAKMSEKLQGLPTTLDQGAAAVKRFTSKNNDVAKSTDMFLALNNALLAGGASTQEQATALEQLSQAYAKGKPDMMEWRSAMTAMPAQLNQVAEAMGFGKNGADALGEALRKGDVTMEQFMETISKMNTEGVNGFKTFEEQAKNSTGGIQTAIAVMKSRITQGIAAIIDEIGAENIANAIIGIGNAIKEIGKKIAGVVKFVEKHWETISSFLPTLGAFVGTLLAIGTAIKIINAVMAVSPVTWIIAGIAAIVAGIVLLITHFDEVSDWIHTNLPWLWNILNSIGNFIGIIIQHIQNVISVLVDFFNTILLPIFSAIGEFLGPILEQMFNNLMDNINFFIGFFTGVFDFVWSILETTLSIATKVFGAIGSFVYGVVENIKGFFGALGGAIVNVFEGVKSVVQNIFSTLAGIIKAPINGIIQAINGVLSFINSITIPDWVPFIGGQHTSFGMVPLLAQGGYARGATTAIIGEAGKEAVLPLEHNTDNWAGLLANTLVEQMKKQGEEGVSGRPITVNMTNEINNEMDAQEIGRIMMESIRRAA